MTGLNLETFLRLLRTDLWVWVSMATVVSVLGLMMWASWGSHRLLRKCLVVSVLAHLIGGETGLGLRAFGPAGLEAARPRPRIRRIRVVPKLETPDAHSVGTEAAKGAGGVRSGRRPMAAWDQPGAPLLARRMDPLRPKTTAAEPVRREEAPREAVVPEAASPEIAPPPPAAPEPRADPPTEPPADAIVTASTGEPDPADLAEVPEVQVAPRAGGEKVPDLVAALRANPRRTDRGTGGALARPEQPKAGPEMLAVNRAVPGSLLEGVPAPRRSLGTRALPEVPAVYRPRLDPDRSVRAQRAGASAASEEAVERALDWLARHQDDDGRWDAATERDGAGGPIPGADDFTVHCPPGDICAGECYYWEADTALTGLALLAYLGAGYTHRDGRAHASTVDKGLRFLRSAQKADGDLRGRSRAIGMYCHAMATLALSEAYALTGDDELRPAVERAVRFLVRGQAADGQAWRYVPGEPIGDTSILGWVILALKSARENGIAVPDAALDGATRWLKRVSAGTEGGLAKYQPIKEPTPTMTAEAWICRQFLGRGGPGAASDEAAAYLLENGPARGPLNLYYWYYGTLAMYQRGGRDWDAWNAQVRDALVSRQERDGHRAGSWDPSACKDRFDALGGRIYCTAIATLTLEVYYRYQRLDSGAAPPPASAPADDHALRRAATPASR